MNKRKINLTIVFSLLTVIFAILTWFTINRAITIPTSSTWGVPMVFFSLYIIFACLSVLLFENMVLLQIVFASSFFASLIFAPSFLQVIAILISSYFIYLSSAKIKEDQHLNIQISTWKSLQAGKSYLLISLAILISMQYFVTIRKESQLKAIPRFDTSLISKKFAIPLLATFNPSFKALQDETMTVDEFILQTQEDAMAENDYSQIDDQLIESQIPMNLTLDEKEIVKNQIKENFAKSQSQFTQKNQQQVVVMGRKQLADLSGAQIKGDEKISDVFIGLIDSKIESFFKPSAGNPRAAAFPLILSVLLFLTIYPIGSMLSIVIFLIVKLIIFLLIRFQYLLIKTETVSKEIIA